MITLQPLFGISILPTPLTEASGIECFREISINSSIAEIARKQEVIKEQNIDTQKPKNNLNKERSLSMGGPTLSPPGMR